MTKARRLLLETTLSVTEICMEVGYSSLGTFISQFGRLIGLSPRRFRAVVGGLDNLRIADLAGPSDAQGPVGAVIGRAESPGRALIGLFQHDRHHDWPVTSDVIALNRVTRTTRPEDGHYEPVAMSFRTATTVAAALAADRPHLIGFAAKPIVVSAGQSPRPFEITLRLPRPFDPPVEFSRALLHAVPAGIGPTTAARSS